MPKLRTLRDRFVADSALEEAVRSELVSEIGIPGGFRTVTSTF
jgi:hypothetical protein